MELLVVLKCRVCFMIILIAVFTLFVKVSGGRVKRIIRGREMPCGAFPRVASLANRTSQKHLCGATLLSDKAALTAAHCVYGSPSDYHLQLKNYCVDDEQDYPQAKVNQIYLHELYDKYSRAHDLAVISIDLDMEDVSWLENDILPDESFQTIGKFAILGYGTQSLKQEQSSETLLGAKLNTISREKCLQLLGIYMTPSERSGQMCGVGVNSADCCQGDSGGPIWSLSESVVVGVSSYGQSCGAPGIPGVYTNVSAHLLWIRNTLKDINGEGPEKD